MFCTASSLASQSWTAWETRTPPTLTPTAWEGLGALTAKTHRTPSSRFRLPLGSSMPTPSNLSQLIWSQTPKSARLTKFEDPKLKAQAGIRPPHADFEHADCIQAFAADAVLPLRISRPDCPRVPPISVYTEILTLFICQMLFDYRSIEKYWQCQIFELASLK